MVAVKGSCGVHPVCLSIYLSVYFLGIKLTKTHVASVSWDTFDPWLLLDCVSLSGMGNLHS